MDAHLPETVTRIVAETPALDVHTHLFNPAFGGLLLWGIDELLRYHYLIAEVFRAAPLPYDKFWAMNPRQQADYVWKHCFIEQSPLSEACRGVLTALQRLGLDPAARDLESYRAFFASRKIRDHAIDVLRIAGLRAVVMTNDPFDDAERVSWQKSVERDPRFVASLRLDALLSSWDSVRQRLSGWGYHVGPEIDPGTAAEVRRFLEDWVRRMDPVYLAASLPPSFHYETETPRGKLIEQCVLPVCRDANLPFAMMIGVRKLANPRLRLAGDAVGRASVEAVEQYCTRHADNKFLVTMLSRENQHELCVAARKFPNLLIFGCWWFLNNPSIVEEITRERVELLGPTTVLQHSDARVLEHVVYKWHHSRRIIASVLVEKYRDLAYSGWQATDDEIRRDVANMLGGNFEKFAKR
jgi:hypothetical protein